MLLAIETSCDETAVSIVDLDAFFEKGIFDDEVLRAELISSQVKLHQEYGGVVPELASREHIKNIPHLLERAFKEANCTCLLYTSPSPRD